METGLRDHYTKEESMKAMLHERDRWDNDLIDYPDYVDRVLHILRWTEGDDF